MLINAGDAMGQHARRVAGLDRRSIDFNLTGVRAHSAGKDLDEGRFSRAVGAN